MPFAVALMLTGVTLPPIYKAQVCMIVTEAPKPKSYLYNVILSINQLLNTITGGQVDETVSSRWAAKRKTSKVARLACNVLDHIQPCHCATALERDEQGNPLAHQLHGDVK